MIKESCQPPHIICEEKAAVYKQTLHGVCQQAIMTPIHWAIQLFVTISPFSSLSPYAHSLFLLKDTFPTLCSSPHVYCDRFCLFISYVSYFTPEISRQTNNTSIGRDGHRKVHTQARLHNQAMQYLRPPTHRPHCPTGHECNPFPPSPQTSSLPLQQSEE